MKTRSLQELYDEHINNYQGFRANAKLESELWKKYEESDQYYIIHAANLLKDYGEMNAFMDHCPLRYESLEQIENEIDHLSQKIINAKYDDFLDKRPSKRLWSLKNKIETFAENIQLMQLLIDSKKQNFEIFVQCMQYIFVDHMKTKYLRPIKQEAPINIVENIEVQFESFIQNKEKLSQKIDELRQQCKQVAGQLFERTIKSDYVSDLQNAIFENKNEEKSAASAANHARLFQMNEQTEAVQQEAELKPGL